MKNLCIGLSILLMGPTIGFAKEAKELRIATWNIEHLAQYNELGCRPRTTYDYLELQRYAKRVDADVWAIQEVENITALERVFPASEYHLIVSPRPTPSKTYACRQDSKLTKSAQKTAFAIKNHIEVHYDSDLNLESIALNPYQRYGLTIQLPAFGNMKLMNVHLKSGCRDRGSDMRVEEKENCKTKAKQFNMLAKWANQQQGYVVLLGDFNRRLTRVADPYLPLFTSMELATKNTVSCHPIHVDSIDHIFTNFNAGDAVAYPFNDTNGNGVDNDVSKMLSDHCAVQIGIAYYK